MIDVTITVHKKQRSQTERFLSVDLTKSNWASHRANNGLGLDEVVYSAMIADDQKRQLSVIIPASPNKQAL